MAISGLAANKSEGPDEGKPVKTQRGASFFNMMPGDTKTTGSIAETKTIRDLCQFSSLNFMNYSSE